jgi:hypothetical protein
MQQETFCASLWWNIFYKEFPSLGKKPCCNWEGPSVGKDPNNKDVNELLNDPDMIRYREMSLNGEWPAPCIRCKVRQDQGLKSYRQTENKKLGVTSVEQLRNAKPEVRTIDYRPSNLCNLKCRMCNPAESSQLLTEMKENKELQEHFSSPPLKTDKIYELADDFEYNTLNTSVASHEVFSTLEELKIFGGEPSIDASVHNLIEWAIDNGYSKKLRFRYTTNATNTNRKWMDYHKHFKNYNISFSLDAANDTFEYIRTPANWKKVKSCVLDYIQMRNSNPNWRRDKLWLSANIVYSLWSCFTITDWHDELIGLLEDNRVDYNLAISFRDNQAVNLLPQKFKDIILEDVDKLPDGKFKTSVIQLTNKPTPDDWKQQINRFFEFSLKYDKIRNTSIFNLSPVYQDLYNYVRKDQ